MLLEVNRLRHLIVDRPSRDHVAGWAEIAEMMPTTFLLDDRDERDWWRTQTPDTAKCRRRRSGYFSVIAGNIRDVLQLHELRPFDAAYITSSPNNIEEAIGTHVGTVLVSAGITDAIPDVFLEDVDALRDALRTLVQENAAPGHLMECFATRRAGGRRAGSVGYVASQRYLRGRRGLDRMIADETQVVLAGRYFTESEARHNKHQFSLRLLHAKRGDRRGNPVIEAAADVLHLLFEETDFDLIARVPPKPSKPEDHLGDLVERACANADARHQMDVAARVDRAAVRCIRDYGDQKQAGSYARRAANVAGAFRANADLVLDKRILLIDDILTSGSTIVEVARVLRRAGACEVTVFPLGITQSIVNYDPDLELPCENERCDGIMRIRFANASDGAFWGCSEWRPGDRGCNSTLKFEEGLREVNRLITTDSIVVVEESTF